MDIAKPFLEKTQWKKIRAEVAPINKELTDIIDDIDPTDSYALYKCRYPYGTEMLQKGKLYLPNENQELVPLTHSTINQNIRDNLSYNMGTNPVSIILKNSAEIFMVMENYTIPLYGIIPSGKIFSTWRVLLSKNISHSPAFLWNMSSGARSIFMLSKISESMGHNRLKREFKINEEKPENLLDHCRVFSALANSRNSNCNWSMEILYFSKKWFERLNDKRWEKFFLYLLKNAWDGSDFWRNQFIWDIAFSKVQDNRNLRPDPFIADTAKHNLTTAVGAVPGFSPALDDNAAPISFLQDVYKNIYQLKNHYPTIMTPHFFNMYENSRPVYYSLQYPCTIEFSPRSRRMTNKTTDLSEIQHVLNVYINEIRKNHLNLNETPLFDMPEKVNFDFFHSNTDKYENIKKSSDIPLEDISFSPQQSQFSNITFPENCPFIRGCIRISNNIK